MADVGQITDTGTLAIVGKANGSPLFYHDGSWWAVFAQDSDSHWYIWKRTGDANWATTSVEVGDRGSDRPDCVVDSANNRMWCLNRHGSSPEITSCTYSGGAWSLDGSITRVSVPFIDSPDNCCLAVARRWSTRTVFAFDYDGTVIAVNWSTNDGQTWQTYTTIADNAGEGIVASTGMTDAVEFSWDSGSGSENYIGVVYGQNGSDSQWGFLYLKEGDAPGTKGNWTHQIMPALTSTPDADDHCVICRDGSTTDNRLYYAVKCASGDHHVFVRDSDSSGTWSIGEQGMSLAASRPCLAYDATNDEVYLGIANASSNATIEYVKSDAGTTLSFGSGVTLFSDDSEASPFGQLQGVHDPVTSTTDMLWMTANIGDLAYWDNLLTIAGAAPSGRIMGGLVGQGGLVGPGGIIGQAGGIVA